MTTTPSWQQTTLIPPEALEARLTLGIVGPGDHLQWQVEVRNATDGALLELRSAPHRALDQLDDEVATAVAHLLQLTRVHLAPF